MPHARRKIVLSVGELAAVSGLLVYGVGLLGYLLFGLRFFAGCVLFSLLVGPPVLVVARRRRERRSRTRAARRRARVAAYSEPWLEWDQAA